MVKMHELIKLANHHGYSITLADLIVKYAKDKPYMCPKCEGEGEYSVTYNAYPQGFPDSGWVYEPKTKVVECDLCNGEGYTSVEYKPNMVQQGWITEQEEKKK